MQRLDARARCDLLRQRMVEHSLASARMPLATIEVMVRVFATNAGTTYTPAAVFLDRLLLVRAFEEKSSDGEATLAIWRRLAPAFSAIVLFATIPGLLIAPLAGGLVDRADRKRLIIVADSVIVVGALLLAGLLAMCQLVLWHVDLANAVASLCQSLRSPAYYAASSAPVPKAHLGRFAGVMQLAASLTQIAGPMLSAPLLIGIGLDWTGWLR